MTPDARYIAFASAAPDLVPGDTNGLVDIFVRDRKTGRTAIASVPTKGSLVDIALAPSVTCYGSKLPAISDNGRYVAFQSCAINLLGLGKDLNAADDIFVHDMQTGETIRASVTNEGAEGAASVISAAPSISADGRYVAFDSANKFAEPCDGATCPSLPTDKALGIQVYVRDLRATTTRLVSATPAGAIANGASYDARISPDGSRVAFATYANNLSANDQNVSPTNLLAVPSAPDIYLRDLRTGSLRLISVGLNGMSAQGAIPESGGRTPDTGVGSTAISGDNRFIAFGSNGTGLVPNSGNGLSGGIFVRDMLKGTTERVSVNSAGESGGCGVGFNVSMSRNGRFVAFACTPDPECAYGHPYASVYDRFTGTLRAVAGHAPESGSPTECPSSANDPAADFNPVLSGDGRFVAFTSNGGPQGRWQTKTATGAPVYEVYLRDRGPILGVAAAPAGPKLAVSSGGGLSATVLGASDARDDVPGAQAFSEGDLVGATVTYRPTLHDFLLCLRPSALPMTLVGSPHVVYILEFTAAGTHYRLWMTGGVPFELQALNTEGQWGHVATVPGGFGTTGNELRAAVDLAKLGIRDKGRIGDLRASTALVGAVDQELTVLDRLEF